MLKHIYNLGDETLAEAWVMNTYLQYFTGAAFFEHRFLCDPSDFAHFRRRIGVAGFRKIFEYNVRMVGRKKEEQRMVYEDGLTIYMQHSKDKVYIFHKPQTACLAKRNASHTYE